MKVSLSEKWYRFCMIVLKQFYVNILWIGFTLLGFVVVGIGPATVGMLAVQKEFVLGNDDVKVFSTFMTSFKEHFKEAAILGLGYLFAGVVLATNMIAIPNFFSRVLFGTIGFFYLISLIYIGPVCVQLGIDGIRGKVKASLILGFSYLQYTLVMMVVLVIAYAAVLLHFGVAFFFGVAVGGFIVTKFTSMVFNRARNHSQEMEI